MLPLKYQLAVSQQPNTPVPGPSPAHLCGNGDGGQESGGPSLPADAPPADATVSVCVEGGCGPVLPPSSLPSQVRVFSVCVFTCFLLCACACVCMRVLL